MAIKKLFITVGFLILTLWLLSQNYQVQAQEKTTVSFSPQNGFYKLGEPLTIQLLVNTNGNTISTAALRLLLNDPNQELIPANLKLSPEITGNGDWSCPIKNINYVGKEWQIDIACINLNPGGFAGSGIPLNLALFDLTVNKNPQTGRVDLKIDSDKSAVTRKIDGADILDKNQSTQASFQLLGAVPEQVQAKTPIAIGTPLERFFSFFRNFFSSLFK